MAIDIQEHFTSRARAHAPANRNQTKETQMITQLNVLIACEESQAECMAFRDLGHIAFSCDVQQCRPGGRPDWHICGDVTPLLNGAKEFYTQDGQFHQIDHWDIIIAHPPCTYLCKVSSVHMIQHGELNQQRYELMIKARAFFFECLNTNAARYVAVENPIPMARARLPRPSCYACPSWFGVKYTKKTLYWTRNLPPLIAECDYPNPKEYVRASRGKYRSRTFPQLAHAIARQWSSYILDELNESK